MERRLKYSRAFLAPLALCLALSACSTSTATTTATRVDNTDSRYAALLKMPLPEFYGTLAIASVVSSSCSSLERNPLIDLELNERRNEKGNGSFAALGQRQAIRSAQASMIEGFKSKHGSNLCGVAARDFEQAQQPYTFFLEGTG